LAVVQSIARQTFDRDLPREEALEIFSSRLRALSEAHSILIRSDWRGADFRELAERQIEPYVQIDGRRVSLNGPSINLPPDVATPLALVLHELATNAMKYGSLSTPDGTLHIDWGFRVNGGNREFRYSWRESGGPKVRPPARNGFGSWLIQNG